MTTAVNNLIIAPILLPLATGALLAMYSESRPFLKGMINVVSTAVSLVIAIQLMRFADGSAPGVYLFGNWPAPFGIVLVLDRLSALMLVLTGILAIAALIFSLARWHKAGAHFHTLFQFLLMGVNGAVLTGDLFNLFVFFEVMLAASYGLVLHGSGAQRVRAGLHYIVVNLSASFLFLVGVSLIYGVTGTLNMADLAARIPTVSAENRHLLEAGAAILGIAFLVKAGMWPLSFWLLETYAVAAAPVAAVFAILSKVGIYVLLRLSLLLFGTAAGASAGFGGPLLVIGGMATIAYGMIGVLASQTTARLATCSVLVSSGTLIAAIGLADPGVTGGALFYLVSSTLTISAFFLLIELIERGQDPAAGILAVTAEAFGDDEDDDEKDQVGVPFPGTLAILGACFAACALLFAGLPPLSGFIGKLAILAALFAPDAPGTVPGIPAMAWIYTGLLVASGLAALIAMSRVGIRVFWAPIESSVPHVLFVEVVPVIALLLLTVALTVQGGPVMAYLDRTARALHVPSHYVEEVLSTAKLPPPEREAPR
jgi:multicomponent K+:H+ antiporter subunit D